MRLVLFRDLKLRWVCDIETDWKCILGIFLELYIEFFRMSLKKDLFIYLFIYSFYEL